MRRFLLLTILSLASVTLYAENGVNRALLLGAKYDSISVSLSKMRAEYAKEDSLRADLAPKIIKAEAELRQCKQEYNAAILSLSKQEGIEALKRTSSAKDAPTIDK